MRPRRTAALAALSIPVVAYAVASDAAPKKAEEEYKNIQVFKGYPADDLIPAMEFMSAALDQECAFCHVDRAPEQDDKKEKKIARQMISMTLAINRDYFEGKREVTCVSCHNGAAHPRTVPAIAAADRVPEHETPKAGALPEAGSILQAYLRAAGGAEAIGKIRSRVQHGTLTGFGNPPLPVVIMAKAPGQRVLIVRTPRGENTTAFDGEHGWLGGPNLPTRELTGGEHDAARLDARFSLPADLKGLFAEFSARPGEAIDGQDAVRVVARNPGQPPVELWFDTGTGLLVRQKSYVESPLGRNPTQIDYGDYREADGIKIPFRWTVARPGGRFTIQIAEMHHNVPVDDDSFRMPAAPPEEIP